VFEVKATNGDTHLGGDDFDQVIIDWMSPASSRRPGDRPAQGPMALQRLKEACEKAKIELSSSTRRHQPAVHHGRRERAEAPAPCR
jgi:molecular chaperone DnaK